MPRGDASSQKSLTSLNALYPATVVLDTSVVVAGDADDDHVLALAVAARASLIVPGDRAHLLPLGRYSDIAIITTREALELLR